MLLKLDIDSREALYDLIQHEGFKTLLAEIEAQVRAVELDVLRFNVETRGERDLVFAKCRAEGARKVQKNLLDALDKFRVASLAASGK